MITFKEILYTLKRKFSFHLIDRYIIKKFLGTFFLSLALILSISVIFDLSEKLDEFLEKSASLKAIIVDYYLNFIPYFAILFSSLFVFISVIFFTSKMAYNTEIIAILSSGVSFRRLLYPYIMATLFIGIISWALNNYMLPKATKTRLMFEERYYHGRPVDFTRIHVHKQISPGVFIYMESYSNYTEIGRRFSMEKFDSGKLVSKLVSDYIKWDSAIDKWVIRNYYIRTINEDKELISTGARIDTTINMHPNEFKQRENIIETMTTPVLNDFLADQRMQGEPTEFILIEKYKRFSVPFSTLILTVIGACISSRKIRGGIGMHIGLGLLIGFSYILFLQFSSQFAINGSIPPLIAVWIPNFLYGGIAYYLFIKARR